MAVSWLWWPQSFANVGNPKDWVLERLVGNKSQDFVSLYIRWSIVIWDMERIIILLKRGEKEICLFWPSLIKGKSFQEFLATGPPSLRFAIPICTICVVWQFRRCDIIKKKKVPLYFRAPSRSKCKSSLKRYSQSRSTVSSQIIIALGNM